MTEGFGGGYQNPQGPVAGGAAAGIPNLIYRPGEAAPDNVKIFADWDTLMAVYATTVGRVLITIDDSITSPAPIPTAGGPTAYTFRTQTWMGGVSQNGLARSEATIGDGTTFSRLPNLTDALLLRSASTTPVVVYVGTLPDEREVVMLEREAGLISDTATFINVTRLLPGGLVIILRDGAQLNEGAGAASSIVTATGGAGPVLASVSILVGEDALVMRQTYASDANGVVSVTARDDSAAVDFDQALYLFGPPQDTFFAFNDDAGGLGLAFVVTAATVVLVPTPLPASITLRCDPTAGAITLPPLPPALDAKRGNRVTVKNQSGSALAINVTSSGADTIDGAVSPFVSVAPRAAITFECDGVSDWMVV